MTIGPNVLDAELGRTGLHRDRGGGDAVVERAVVAGVGERVPVRRRLRCPVSTLSSLVGEVGGVAGERDDTMSISWLRVDRAPGITPGLRTVVRRIGIESEKRLAAPHRGRAALHRGRRR